MSSNAQRFGEVVLQRRQALDLNQLEVQKAGGPSNTKQTEIENGRLVDLTPSTAKKVDAGLRWLPGSARDVWNGGEPIPLEVKQRPNVGRIMAELEALGLNEEAREYVREQLRNEGVKGA